MECFKYIDEFEKTLKVLESCETKEQVLVADTYFNLFLSKWIDEISEGSVNHVTSRFLEVKKLINKNIPK
jgi:hypothetical protein